MKKPTADHSFSGRLWSLTLAAIMIFAAALSVNKSLFGHDFRNHVSEAPATLAALSDTVTTMPDGSRVVHTSGMPGTIAGYAGPVPLDITIANGRIAAVEALPNAETPSFFEHAKSLLPAWNGLTPEEALTTQVDAVSGATYSSNAIISNVNAGVAYYIGSTRRSSPHAPWKLWVALGVTLMACILPLFIKNRIYHYIQMAANIGVLGFWCGQFLDYTLVLKYVSSGFIWPAGFISIAMLAAAFLYPLFGHPQHYCNHVCPLGSAQQLTAMLCGYKLHIPPKVLKGLDWFRRILWAVLMLLLWTDTLTGWMDLELFQAFQVASASPYIIGTAAFFVVLSAIISRPYCRFVCPIGSLFKRAENIG